MTQSAKVVVIKAGAATPPDMKALLRNGVLGIVVSAGASKPVAHDTKASSKSDNKTVAAQQVGVAEAPAPPSPEQKLMGEAVAGGLRAAIMLPLTNDMKDAIAAAQLVDGSRLFLEVKEGTKPSELSQQISDLRSVIGLAEPNVVLTVKLGAKTVKEYSGLFDGVLADWTDLWVSDDSKEALAAGEPTWPKATFARWRLWEWGEVDFKEVGKFEASTYNGLDEEFERWFVGQPPPSASEVSNAQVGLQRAS